MKSRYPNRKYPRLKRKEIYAQPGTIVHIIMGTYEKHAYFSKDDPAENLKRIIIETAKEKGNKLYAYCIMPDHVHFLLSAAEGCSIIDFVKHVKGRFSVYCRKAGERMKWQRSFYDHVLRKEEDVLKVAEYIIGNPVRAKISVSIGEYPFAGSLVFDL